MRAPGPRQRSCGAAVMPGGLPLFGRRFTLRRMTQARILVVDDEVTVCEAYADALTARGYAVTTALTAEEGMRAAAASTFDLILLDKRLPDGDGLEMLPRLKRLSPDPDVIMITAYASVQDGVTAIKEGAFDYLIKPIDLTELTHKVGVVLERRQLRRRVSTLEQELSERLRQHGIVGESTAIRDMLARIEKLGGIDCNVLILGETGTGKELAARALHASGGARDKRPFVALNCAALPESIVERELFGHESGAFTGASKAKPGFFEAADGGTLFLDEVTELSPRIQAKLLRVTESGEFYRLGSSQPSQASVRLISATNQQPAECVASGRFREDLLYRLSVVTIEIPPLRQRRDDIPLLARHFIGVYARKYERCIEGFDDPAMARLQAFDWPGNVRELQHAMEHACAFCHGSLITLDDLPPYLAGEAASAAGDLPLPKRYADLPYTAAKRLCVADFTRALVSRHLDQTGGNITEAAERLGMHRTALQRLMRKFGISR